MAEYLENFGTVKEAIKRVSSVKPKNKELIKELKSINPNHLLLYNSSTNKLMVSVPPKNTVSPKGSKFFWVWLRSSEIK